MKLAAGKSGFATHLHKMATPYFFKKNNTLMVNNNSLKNPITIATVQINDCWHSVDGKAWYNVIFIPVKSRYQAYLWGNDNDGYQDYLYQANHIVLDSSPEFASEQAAHDYAKAHWMESETIDHTN